MRLRSRQPAKARCSDCAKRAEAAIALNDGEERRLPTTTALMEMKRRRTGSFNMKRIALGTLAAVCFAFIGTTGSNAASIDSTAIARAAAADSLVQQAYVYRRSVYRGTAYGGCRRVRTCG